MTQINTYQSPEVMGIIGLSIIPKVVKQHISKGIVINESAKVGGSNYKAVLGHLNNAMKAFQNLTTANKNAVRSQYQAVINKGRNAYMQHADILMNLYRAYLTTNNPGELPSAIQNYTLDMRDLIDTRHPTTNTKEIQAKNEQMESLRKELQNYGKDISTRQLNLVEEQTRQQGAIIAYETDPANAKKPFNFTSLLIPAALGVGAIMLFKG